MITATTTIVDVKPSIDSLQSNNQQQEGGNICDVCGRQLPHRNALRMHLVKTHGRVENDADYRLKYRLRNPITAIQRFICPQAECRSRPFASMKLLKQHFQKCHSTKNLHCPYCESAVFALKRDLDFHQRRRCPNRPSPIIDNVHDIDTTGTMETGDSSKKNTVDHKRGSDRSNVPQTVTIVINNPTTAQKRPIVSRRGKNRHRDAETQTDPITIWVPEIQQQLVLSGGGDFCSVASQSSTSIASYAFDNQGYCPTASSSSSAYPTMDFAAQFGPIQCGVQTTMHNKNNDNMVLDDYFNMVNMHTQTLLPSIDALTQTSRIHSMDSASMTDDF